MLGTLAVGTLAVALAGVNQRASAQTTTDPWWGRDKALHFSVSAAISVGSYAVAIPLWEPPSVRAVFAASIGLGVGIAKELFDATGAGDPSWRDLAWDAIGVATGTLLMWVLDLLIGNHDDAVEARGPPEPDTRTAPTYPAVETRY